MDTEQSLYSGAGLGLAIAKELATTLDGQLGVESVPGTGSKFSLSVAIRTAELAPMNSGRDVTLALYGRVRQLKERLTNLAAVHVTEITGHEDLSEANLLADATLVIDSGDVRGWMETLPNVRTRPQCAILVVSQETLASSTQLQLPSTVCFLVRERVHDPDLTSAVQTIRRTFHHGAYESPNSPGPSILDGIKILVANDSRTNRELALLFLTNAGATVRAVANGADAVEVAERLELDAILLDWNMPVMEGSEVIKRLRSDSRHARAAIIVLTGQDKRSIEPIARLLGADVVLQQPTPPSTIIQSIAAAIGDRRKPDCKQSGTSEIRELRNFDFGQYSEMLSEGTKREEIERLLRLFVEETGSLIESLNWAARFNERSECRRLLHAISGAAHAAGALSLAASTERIMTTLDAWMRDSEGVGDLVKVWVATKESIVEWSERDEPAA